MSTSSISSNAMPNYESNRILLPTNIELGDTMTVLDCGSVDESPKLFGSYKMVASADLAIIIEHLFDTSVSKIFLEWSNKEQRWFSPQTKHNYILISPTPKDAFSKPSAAEDTTNVESQRLSEVLPSNLEVGDVIVLQACRMPKTRNGSYRVSRIDDKLVDLVSVFTGTVTTFLWKTIDGKSILRSATTYGDYLPYFTESKVNKTEPVESTPKFYSRSVKHITGKINLSMVKSDVTYYVNALNSARHSTAERTVRISKLAYQLKEITGDTIILQEETEQHLIELTWLEIAGFWCQSQSGKITGKAPCYYLTSKSLI